MLKLILKASFPKESKVCEREFSIEDAKAARKWAESKLKAKQKVYRETTHEGGYDLLSGDSLEDIKNSLGNTKGMRFSEVTSDKLDKIFHVKMREEKK